MGLEIRSVHDSLPSDGEYVLAHLNYDHWHDSNDASGGRYWVVAKFVKGISQADREKLDGASKRKRMYLPADEHGNNLVNYCWSEFGPTSHFGQSVDYWMHLPALPEPAKPKESPRCYLPYRVYVRALDGVNPDEWREWCDFESAEQAWFAVRQEQEQDAKFPPQRYRYKVARIDGSELLPPEYEGDTRDPMAGCWHVTDQMHNSSSFGPNHCRKPCVIGSRYCEDHQVR